MLDVAQSGGSGGTDIALQLKGIGPNDKTAGAGDLILLLRLYISVFICEIFLYIL